jgi:hypothetical protein
MAVLAGFPSLGLTRARAQTPSPQVAVTQPASGSSQANSDGDRIAALEKRVADQSQAIAKAQMSGDNSWMLTSSALVLLMTGPGLALFYGGLVRKKNVLGTMMQSFAMMAVITVLWAVVTYSLAFSSGNAFIGGLHNMFLHGVGLDPSAYAPTIPLQTFMVFQLMFAIITPALITGAFAERMKFSAMLVFMVLWAIVVYSPMAHMVWGEGGLLNSGSGRFPCMDFAGGTVVHITSGVSALITALYLGKRIGYPKEAMQPHSVVLSFIGACLLWVGWFGFNSGSALAVCGDPLRRGGGGDWMERGGVDPQRQAIGAGRDLRGSGRAGGDYAGVGVCIADVRDCDWAAGRRGMLLHGGEGEGVVRLRRFPGCVRSARRGRDHWRAADRAFCQKRHQPGLRRGQADRRAGGQYTPDPEPGGGRGDCLDAGDCRDTYHSVHRG